MFSRLVLNFIYFMRFGLMSENPETWLYLGIMRGTQQTANKGYDITNYLLRFMGAALPENLHLPALVFLGIILSCWTAYMIYKFTGNKYAGLFYLALLQPMYLNIMGFTHDLVSFPIALTAAYLGWWGVLLWPVALGVNPSSAAILCIYLLSKIKLRYNLLSVGAVAAVLYSIAAAVDTVLYCMPQGRYGSPDIVPATITGLLLRYNLLLPLCAAFIFKHKSLGTSLSRSFLLMGGAIAIVADRGTRFLDVGFALLFAEIYRIYPVRSRQFLFFMVFASIGLSLAYMGGRIEPVKEVLVTGNVSWGTAYLGEYVFNASAKTVLSQSSTGYTPPQTCEFIHKII